MEDKTKIKTTPTSIYQYVSVKQMQNKHTHVFNIFERVNNLRIWVTAKF